MDEEAAAAARAAAQREIDEETNRWLEEEWAKDEAEGRTENPRSYRTSPPPPPPLSLPPPPPPQITPIGRPMTLMEAFMHPAIDFLSQPPPPQKANPLPSPSTLPKSRSKAAAKKAPAARFSTEIQVEPSTSQPQIPHPGLHPSSGPTSEIPTLPKSSLLNQLGTKRKANTIDLQASGVKKGRKSSSGGKIRTKAAVEKINEVAVMPGTGHGRPNLDKAKNTANSTNDVAFNQQLNARTKIVATSTPDVVSKPQVPLRTQDASIPNLSERPNYQLFLESQIALGKAFKNRKKKPIITEPVKSSRANSDGSSDSQFEIVIPKRSSRRALSKTSNQATIASSPRNSLSPPQGNRTFSERPDLHALLGLPRPPPNLPPNHRTIPNMYPNSSDEQPIQIRPTRLQVNQASRASAMNTSSTTEQRGLMQPTRLQVPQASRASAMNTSTTDEQLALIQPTRQQIHQISRTSTINPSNTTKQPSLMQMSRSPAIQASRASAMDPSSTTEQPGPMQIPRPPIIPASQAPDMYASRVNTPLPARATLFHEHDTSRFDPTNNPFIEMPANGEITYHPLLLSAQEILNSSHKYYHKQRLRLLHARIDLYFAELDQKTRYVAQEIAEKEMNTMYATREEMEAAREVRKRELEVEEKRILEKASKYRMEGIEFAREVEPVLANERRLRREAKEVVVRYPGVE